MGEFRFKNIENLTGRLLVHRPVILGYAGYVELKLKNIQYSMRPDGGVDTFYAELVNSPPYAMGFVPDGTEASIILDSDDLIEGEIRSSRGMVGYSKVGDTTYVTLTLLSH